MRPRKETGTCRDSADCPLSLHGDRRGDMIAILIIIGMVRHRGLHDLLGILGPVLGQREDLAPGIQNRSFMDTGLT